MNYSLGMLYARRDQTERAARVFGKRDKPAPGLLRRAQQPGSSVCSSNSVIPKQKTKFKTCIQQAPDFDQAYLNLARLYLVLNDKEKARAVLQALLQKQPQHKMAQQMLQMLY